ncbi:hypothetical protein ACPF8X_24410 [Streptomyces sp. G35A]
MLRDMVRALDKVASNGGIISSDPPKQKYQFASGQHISLDADIQANLWRFGLSPMARDLLDHMATQHNEEGELRTTQKELATHFGCSQPKVSKALTQLDKLHLAWKVRRGVLQVNPTYAYRWGSRKQRALIARLGAKFLRERTIVIPEAGR